VAIHAQGSLGSLPGFDLGLGGGLGLASRRFRLELRGTYGVLGDRIAHASAPPGATGRFNLLSGSLTGCFNLGRDTVAFGPCADAEAGLVSAKGVGTNQEYTARNTWLAVGGGGYLAIALTPRLQIPLHLAILAPLRRPEYVIEGVNARVYQASPVGVRVRAAMAWRFY